MARKRKTPRPSQTPEKIRAKEELRRSGAAGTHRDTTPRTEIERRAIEEQE